MYEFRSTEEIITFCFADFSIRSNTKGLVLEKLNGLESDRFVSLLSHRSIEAKISMYLEMPAKTLNEWTREPDPAFRTAAQKAGLVHETDCNLAHAHSGITCECIK